MRRVYSTAGFALLVGISTAAANDSDAVKFISYCERELYVTKNYEEASKVCKRVKQDVLVLVGLSPLYLRSVVDDADAKWALGNYPEAFNLYAQAADVAIKLGDTVKIIELRIRQAEAELFRGKSFEAEILLRDAITRVQGKTGNNALQEADLFSRHAEVLVALGQTKAAQQGYLAAFAKLDAESAKDRPVLLKTQLRYAELFERQSRYTAAMASYQRLLKLAQSDPLSADYMIIAYERMGWISETLHKREEALLFYRHQLEIIEKDPARSTSTDELRRKILRLEN
jgi:tetratricopeptide (TPR) repeat protein